MEREDGSRTGDVLAGILELLDHLDDDRALTPDTERLALAGAAIQAADRLRTLAALLVAETRAHDSDISATGLPIVSWLADTRRMTRPQANALLHDGRDLAALPLLRAAAEAGQVSPAQARAISRVLADLPDDLDIETRHRAEATMVGYAGEFDSRGLSTLTEHLLQVIAPEVAARSEAERLARQERRSRRNRRLSFTNDGHGSVLIRGSLPAADAQTLIAQIEAIARAEQRRALDALDPLAEQVTPTMRRADALIALAEAAALHRDAPTHGGDRPRIVVTIPEARLRDLATGARLVGPDQPVGPGDLRRLCCDADLVPIVLGADSEVLDVGREHRLVTGPIRTALTVRDGGCAFPGCDRPPADCHAHHITPWQKGGPTSLENLVLLCPHHHGIVEPVPASPGRRWEVRMGTDHLPEILPPIHVDPVRQPRRHQRFRRPQAA